MTGISTSDPASPDRSRRRGWAGRGGPPQRRSVGLLLVLLVACAAVVAPTALAGRRVAGTPQGMQFPAPPRVGDCVQAPMPSIRTGGLAAEIPITDVTLGPCDGLIGGEVVAWVAQRPPGEDVSAARRVRGPCFRAVVDYAGLSMTGRRVVAPGAPMSDVIRWAPTVGFDAHRLVPGPAEQEAGRTWFACVAVPTSHAGYSGTLSRAFADGRLPDPFGWCWDGTDLDLLAKLLRCDEPHAAELLATAWVPDRSRVTEAEMQAGCQQVVASLLRRPDPTAGGALSVVIDPVSGDGATNPGDPQSVGCFVAAQPPGLLVGTLVGLGERPVPLAG